MGIKVLDHICEMDGVSPSLNKTLFCSPATSKKAGCFLQSTALWHSLFKKVRLINAHASLI